MYVTTPLTVADHSRWREHWLAYQAFYKVSLPQAVTESTWQKILAGRIHALGARSDRDGLVGIVHFLYHEDTWSVGPACYLEDLYVQPDQRGTGCGRLLIEAVAAAASAAGAHKTYWLTHESNAVARQLYDRLGSHPGFLYYSFGKRRRD
jgi:GNAT superfamily N-acetyltransferase